MLLILFKTTLKLKTVASPISFYLFKQTVQHKSYIFVQILTQDKLNFSKPFRNLQCFEI